jgi:hypothetical protein
MHVPSWRGTSRRLLRKSLPFGAIKSRTCPCHFLTRRLNGVGTEIALNVLAYNIQRTIALTRSP